MDADLVTRQARGVRVAVTGTAPGTMAGSSGPRATAEPAVLTVPCGPEDPAEVGQAVDAVIDRFGRLDHVVNLIAARPVPGLLMELDPLPLRAVLHRDLVMPLACVQRAYRRWMATHGGSVVNVVADVVRGGPQDAALAGLTELTEWLAAELAPRVAVHTVMPSPSIGTDAYRTAIADTLCALLSRPADPAHGPVLVLTGELVRPPRAA
ncbi:SDR family oxidoreductase [Streptomyces cupreus]|uniref:Peroxisomal trans-2-enoyl-CoA reductase n=1 Tax=Streptomyces cupreus TaxID=2759956 RepID=A0A7X1JC62_9ACTN|nr:SDR family oxidoreductase [Streptomyces cupreus]MBC2907052.1 SDR family oxidoreductase [Streptomyces cupreus]